MHPEPLHTKDMVVIAALIIVSIVAFWVLVTAVGKAKPVFDAIPVNAKN